jgi:hypothetical protein
LKLSPYPPAAAARQPLPGLLRDPLLISPLAWKARSAARASASVMEREHAKSWGRSCRGWQRLFIVRGPESGMAPPEGVLERAVQHGRADVEEGLHGRPVPAHLLRLVHALGHDLVDRTLHERGRDRLTTPTPGRVVHQRAKIALEVAQQASGCGTAGAGGGERIRFTSVARRLG